MKAAFLLILYHHTGLIVMAASTSTTNSSSIFPVTGWFKSLSSAFPRVTFDSVPIRESCIRPEKYRQKAILYVDQGHPSPRSTGASSKRWASRDPRCLAWQMQFIFRGIPFECVQVHDDYTALDYHGEGFANVPMILDVDGTVVGQKHLKKWADTVKPFSEECTEKVKGAEAKTLNSVIQGPLMAGVLLELILLPDNTSSARSHVPFLARKTQSHLALQKRARIAAQIHALRHSSPTSQMPGWVTTMHGLLNTGGGIGSTGTATEESEEDTDQGLSIAALGFDTDQLDQESIRTEACEAIDILATLYPIGNTQGSEEEAGSSWLCGTSTPTQLDAAFFGLLHTIMSLPVQNSKKSLQGSASLRSTVEKYPHLMAYTRRIWTEYVKPLGG